MRGKRNDELSLSNSTANIQHLLTVSDAVQNRFVNNANERMKGIYYFDVTIKKIFPLYHKMEE